MDEDKSLPYHQLEASKREFRLVRLLDSSSDRIQCELGSFSLLNNDLPPWKALSYRWGEDEPECVVYLGDHPMPVRKILYGFIAQMAAEERRDWFFIDAICINQENESEKPSQVTQMGEIYRRAKGVVIWIVYEPYHYEDNALDTGQATYDPVDDSVDILSMSREKRERAVLENSFWSRLWIVQEVLLAAHLIIRIGSAEVDWLNLPELNLRKLLDDGSNLISKWLPIRNDSLGLRQPGTVPYANKQAALHILSYKIHRCQSLRTGHYLPFHQTFDFFATHCCGRPHDKVFGLLGLTNSRIPVDYSMSILDLFVATLADYLMSAGFITEDLTSIWKRTRNIRPNGIVYCDGLVSPILAFDLDPFDPVVNLLFYEVAKFFAPGYIGESLTNNAMLWLWGTSHRRQNMRSIWDTSSDDGHEWTYKTIGSFCFKFVKLITTEMNRWLAFQKDIAVRQKALAEDDAVMVDGKVGESKKYSEWVTYARAISEQMWRRFQESGEDTEGDMDDEAWTLIA